MTKSLMTDRWDREFKKQLDYIQAKNETVEALECYHTLHRICTNILNNPNESKYRYIKQRSKTLQRILGCAGGEDLIDRFSKRRIQDFEVVFVFGDIDTFVPGIIEQYFDNAAKKMEKRVSEKEMNRLVWLQTVDQDRDRQRRQMRNSLSRKSGVCG